MRGCQFANGAVDCRQQVAPEEPTVKAQVAAYREPVNRFAAVRTNGIRLMGRMD